VDVVKNEAPEIEEKRTKLVLDIADNKNKLKYLENQILFKLSNSDETTILDDVPLIDTLEVSKVNSIKIAKDLIEAEKVEKTIQETRDSYSEVSVRGSILYFVISDLAAIDSMYQNSLKYMKKLFNEAIRNTEPQNELKKRIHALKEQITKNLYQNICRGLFEDTKLIYSFMICTSILRKEGKINEVSWNYLLRGAGIQGKAENPSKPEAATFITDGNWDLVCALQTNLPSLFGKLVPDIKANNGAWENYALNEDEQYLEKIPCGYGEKLPLFEKLLLLKIFKTEKLMFACGKYVQEEMG